MTVTEEFWRFHQSLERSTGVTVAVPPPASPQLLDEFERRLGFPLPNQIRQLYQCSDGGIAAPEIGDYRSLSGSGFRKVAEWTRDLTELYHKDPDGLRPARAREPFVPVFNLPGQDFVVEPDFEDGRPGRVMSMDVVNGFCYPVGNSVEGLLATLADLAELGMWGSVLVDGELTMNIMSSSDQKDEAWSALVREVYTRRVPPEGLGFWMGADA